MSTQFDAGTTVKRMESDMLGLLREKFQKYTEEILHFLNIELVLKGDSDVVEYVVPGSTLKISFNPENEGYGVKVFNGRDLIFVSPSEVSWEDGSTFPLEEGMLQMSDTLIRLSLELLKEASESLQDYVNQKRTEFQEKIDLISKY
ncbi:hypothetical protein WDW89_12710 [Deltaproteobacteria bacterium TL4]